MMSTKKTEQDKADEAAAQDQNEAAEQEAQAEENVAEVQAKEAEAAASDETVKMHDNSAGPLQNGNVKDFVPRQADPYAHQRSVMEKADKKTKK